MRKTSMLVAALVFSVSIFAQKITPKASAKPNAITLKNFDDSLSYAIGLSVADFYKGMGLKSMNTSALSDAIKKVFANDTTRWGEQEVQSFLMYASEKVNQQKASAQKSQSDYFMSQNKTKPGVVTTSSGLQYKVLKQGTGEKPTIKDTVVCHYLGTLIDGEEFDNSYKRGEPITFPVSGVIKGWTEALQLMPNGSKWRLFIPSALAYGDRGAGKEIPPGAALVFDVELLDIKKAN